MPVEIFRPKEQEDGLSKLAKALQVAQAVTGIKADLTLLEKTKAEQQAAQEERMRQQAIQSEENAPDSPILSAVRARGEKAGLTIPEGLNYRQAKAAGLLDSISKAEEIRLKGQEERLTASAKAPRGSKRVLNPDTGKIETVADTRPLPANQVLAVNEGKNIPRQLVDIDQSIQANEDLFGPVRGTVGRLNPYDERAKTLDAQLRASSQAFGRYMEGGVLRKEDEEKYRKMFPQLTDTPEVARNKLAIVDRNLKQKLASDVQALEGSGFDVAGVKGGVQAAPDVPRALKGKRESIPEALAGDGGNQVRVVDGVVYRKVPGGWQEM